MLSNLSALNMGVQNLQNFQQHSDVLEKIKMQVRDMKVGFLNSDFTALHPSFTSTLQNSLNFSAAAQNLQNTTSQSNNDSSNGFPFTSSTPAANKDGNKIFGNLI
jgi:cysteinyl-tRNA synthetase